MKITKTFVASLDPPKKGQAIYRDSILKGFGVRITANGVKSYVIEKRIGRHVRRKTLGRAEVLSTEEARIEAQKFLGDVARGRDPIALKREAEARQVTLKEAFDEYMAVRTGLSDQTVHDYNRVMREMFKDWQSRYLTEITKDMVQSRHRRYGAKSPARANNGMRVLRAVFNFARGQYEDAQGRSLFPENPVSRLSHTRSWYREKRRQTVITRSQLPKWAKGVESLREGKDPLSETVADYLLLLLFTGLRRSEGLNLEWDRVDLEEKTLTIVETKNHETLVLPLSEYLCDLLRRRKKDRDERESKEPYVFPGRNEGPMVEMRKQMWKVTEKSGVRFTLHDLRRTFITVAEGLELSVYAIKRLVNHKTGADVTAGYVIMSQERLRQAMRRITEEILELMSDPDDTRVVPIRKRTKKVVR